MTTTHPAPLTRRAFGGFGLHDRLERAIAAAGFTEPRPIQVETIPACLEGRDVMGLAQTGTGKTAAFALPILQRLLEEPGDGPLVLILAPTRELARQIDAEIRTLGRHTDIASVTLFGGTSARSQIQALRRRPEIVVGCPGRVLDLARQGELDLSKIETLVLDEADHMFDMGFLPDIKKILSRLPRNRQNLLFSATMPNAIRQLAHGILHDPHVVELPHTLPVELIEHALCPTAEDRKHDLLEFVLAEDDCQTAIVFTRTKHRAKRLAKRLAAQGVRATALQGNMSQPQRDRAMAGFRAGRFDVLVATDIAARGLDVAGVDYVVNFDPPHSAETYTHRIGRTGRSGAAGKARTFVTQADGGWVRDTERAMGARIPVLRYPGFEDTGARGARVHSGRNSSHGRNSSGAASDRGRPSRDGTSRANPSRDDSPRSAAPGTGRSRRRRTQGRSA